VVSWWVCIRASNFLKDVYYPIMDNTRKELWDQLDGETERAFGAFQAYMSLPSRDRTVLRAYRQHVGNPGAVNVSDTWSRWSRQFAWSQRARARDAHLDRIRERSMEKAIEEEAERQAREAERMRGRFNELLGHGYLAATEWLENAQPSDFRPSDVIQITRLHMDAIKAFEATETPREEVTLTEEELAELTQIIEQIEAEGTEEEPKESSGEDDCEESEDEQL
jgi:hypothetical protein